MSDPGLFNLQEFTLAFFGRSGAVLEPSGYALTETLLPDEMSGSMAAEQLTLAFDYEVAAENPGSVFMTMGTPLLDQVIQLTLERYGQFTELYRPGPLPVLPRNFDQKLQRLELRHCRPPKVNLVQIQDVAYFGYHFRTIFRSHEKSEELLEVVLNGSTGQVQTEFAQAWSKVVPAEAPDAEINKGILLPAAKLYGLACREIEKQAGEKAAQVAAGVNGLKIKELAKIAAYYDEMQAEIQKKISSGGDPQKLARWEKQLAAIQADRARRENDALERYGVEVNVLLDHVVAYHVPCLIAKLDVQSRNTVLPLTVIYNPLTGEIETPVCPQCGQAGWTLKPDPQGRLVCAGGCRPDEL